LEFLSGIEWLFPVWCTSVAIQGEFEHS